MVVVAATAAAAAAEVVVVVAAAKDIHYIIPACSTSIISVPASALECILLQKPHFVEQFLSVPHPRLL